MLGIFVILISIWTVQTFRFFTMMVELPNGAVVARSLDRWKGTRADLYASRHGRLLVRDIDMICYDATTIKGFAGGAGQFIWTRGEGAIITSHHPDYLRRSHGSRLTNGANVCDGLSDGYVSGELLLWNPRRALAVTESQQSRAPHTP